MRTTSRKDGQAAPRMNEPGGNAVMMRTEGHGRQTVAPLGGSLPGC
jgi:hypothetical protein